MSEYENHLAKDSSTGALKEDKDKNDIQYLLDEILHEYPTDIKTEILFSTDFPNFNYVSDPLKELKRQLIKARNEYEQVN